MATYCESNNKPSEIASKTSVLKNHLGPFFGRSRLDAIQPREIEGFKSAKLKTGLSPKRVNNCLTILRRILSLAAEWEIISHTPPVKWLKVPDPEFDFLDFADNRAGLAAEIARIVKEKWWRRRESNLPGG